MLFLLAALQSCAAGDERGVSTAQYAMLAGLMALGAMAIAVILGGVLEDRLGR